MFRQRSAMVLPVLAAALLLSAPLLGREARARVRTVYLSVIDNNGAPVKDLTATDLDIKEGGQVREIAEVKLATSPIRMAFLVADGGAGGFEPALAGILQKTVETTEVSISGVVEHVENLVDYTTDVDKLVEAIKKLGRRANRQTSGPLMEAIADTLKTLPKPGHRPILIVMRAGGAAVSPIRADVVRETIRKTGTRLYVIAGRGSGSSGAAAGGGGSLGMGQARTDYASSESASRGRDLETVLNDGSKESGGRYVEFSGQALVPTAESVADEIMAQYEVSYLLPDGVEPSDRLEVTTKRKNVKLGAPTRIAN